jgi:transcriptional regulator with AAA-type ATPase domain
MSDVHALLDTAGIDFCVIRGDGTVAWRSARWDERWNEGHPTLTGVAMSLGLARTGRTTSAALLDAIALVQGSGERLTLPLRCDVHASERHLVVSLRRVGDGVSVAVFDNTLEWTEQRQRLALDDLVTAMLQTSPGAPRTQRWLEVLCAHFEVTIGTMWRLAPGHGGLELSSVSLGGQPVSPPDVPVTTRLPDGESLARTAWLSASTVVTTRLPAEDARLAERLLELHVPPAGWAIPFGGRGPDSGVFVFYVVDRAVPAPETTHRLAAMLSPPAGALPTSVRKSSDDEAFQRAVRSDSSVLLLGETGSGKTWLARKLHDSSVRAGRPFIELNCAGLSAELLESELFGHEKGSFTGAASRKPGLFEVAEGGTVFLDEIGELDLLVQAKLLKVLETRRLRRVGGTSEVSVDFRLVCATNRDLRAEVEQGRFRSDLFFRIDVLELRVQPLRSRPWEVAVLASELLLQLRAITRITNLSLGDDALPALLGYPWPGNVRELRNVLERAALLTSDGIVGNAHILSALESTERSTPSPLPSASAPTPWASPSPTPHVSSATPVPALRAQEKQLILETFERCAKNLSEASRVLGIPRTTLRTKLRRFGVLE